MPVHFVRMWVWGYNTYDTHTIDEPVFEVPSEKYSAEAIVRILLDPKIEKEKICKKRPLNIWSSRPRFIAAPQ